jgi:hypothetical protein
MISGTQISGIGHGFLIQEITQKTKLTDKFISEFCFLKKIFKIRVQSLKSVSNHSSERHILIRR